MFGFSLIFSVVTGFETELGTYKERGRFWAVFVCFDFFGSVLACFLICGLVLLAIKLFLFVLIPLLTDVADRFFIMFFYVVLTALRCDERS